jgi:hypothetical protein
MTGTVSDVAPSTITCCVRLLRNALIHPCMESRIRNIRSNEDTIVLQDDLNKLADWEQKWGMDFHPHKCSTLHERIQSSAKSRMRDCTQYGRSFIKIRNNKGHRTVPWGTPLMTGTVSDVAPSTITCCVRLLRNALIHPCVESQIP